MIYILYYRLSKLYTELKQFDNVVGLLQTSNEYFSIIPKARTAKIVRNILDIVSKVPDSLIIQVRLCKDVVTWCNLEKRNFLRQRIESKVIFHNNISKYTYLFFPSLACSFTIITKGTT